MAAKSSALPDWIRRWLQFSTVVCLYDSLFILLRPHSMPGGSLENVFYGYRLYFAVDKLYSDMNDSFVYAQTLLNLVEVNINIICLVYNDKNSRKTVPLTFTVSVMTFWKTVTYFVVYWNMEFRQDNTWLQEVLVVGGLSGVWLLVPFLCMRRLWQDVCGFTVSSSTLKRNDVIHEPPSPKTLRDSTVSQRHKRV